MIHSIVTYFWKALRPWISLVMSSICLSSSHHQFLVEMQPKFAIPSLKLIFNVYVYVHFPFLPGVKSAKAEYRSVTNVVSETCWIRNLLFELHCSIPTTTLVYCDNVSDVYLSGNPIHNQCTKHIEMDIHFVHEKVQCGDVWVLHVPSRN